MRYVRYLATPAALLTCLPGTAQAAAPRPTVPATKPASRADHLAGRLRRNPMVLGDPLHLPSRRGLQG
ncbi:MAG TPA: hypothetical protein VGP70_18000 [Actinomadura sp.]|nr:hypothetical protein [Actinomadura sp.]